MRVTTYLRKSFFIIILGVMPIICCPAVFAQPQAIGQVVWVKGEIHAALPGEKPRVLQRRSDIYENDQIDSNGKATGEIVFTDGAILTISPGTSFHMDQYKFSKESPASDKYIVNVAKGGFRTITGAISKANPEGYQVNTPVATIGVRGTDYSFYYVACNTGESCGLSLKIIGGSISVQNAGGTIVLTQGTNMIYARVTARTQVPAITKQAPPILKNNASLQPAAYQNGGPSGPTGGGPTGSSTGGSSTGSSTGNGSTGSPTTQNSSITTPVGVGSSTGSTTINTGTTNVNGPVSNKPQTVSGFCIQ